MIYDELNYRDAVSHLINILGIDRLKAGIVYNSTMIWLRSKYIQFAKCPEMDSKEFDLLQDISLVLDDDNYKAFRIALAGMTVRLPL
jgi:hypothetical protein